jgi:ribosomal protein L11 methyltransferase
LAEASRLYAGLDVTWAGATGRDDDPMADLVLAETDAFHPSAVETSPQGLRVFFTSTTDREAASTHLRHALPQCGAVAVDVADERWAERSQAALKAVQIGALTVAPPWDVPAGDSRVIIIQPSMGFGTGHHASTRLCLRLLQAAPVAGASVLDVGTGSGVLAIAASKLGAASVAAIDFDPDAIASARECAALNDVADVIDIRQLDLERVARVPGEPFDMTLANLTGGMLIRMARRLCGLTAAGGTLIVSGVTREEEVEVTAAFQMTGATLATRLVEDGDNEWVGLRFTTSPRRPTRA